MRVGQGLHVFFVDMKGLLSIDSTGISVLIKGAKLIRSKGGDIVLSNVPGNIEKLLKPVNMQRFIKFFDSLDDVINFFRYL